MQGEKPGTDQERESDEEHPRIAAPPGCFAHDEAEQRTHECDGEHEPEVRTVILPVHVPLGLREQKDEPTGARERARAQRTTSEVNSERQRRRGVLRHVDQRLDGEEGADGDDEADEDARLKQRLARR